MPGLSCMNSDFLCFCITYLFREPRSIVGVAPSRERVGAYRTTHLISLGMAQAPGLGHAGRRRIGRSSRVPPPWGRTPLRCSASADALQFGGEDQQNTCSAFRCNVIVANFKPYVNMKFRCWRINFRKNNGSVTLGSNRRRCSRSVMEKYSKQPLCTTQISGRGPHGKS